MVDYEFPGHVQRRVFFYSLCADRNIVTITLGFFCSRNLLSILVSIPYVQQVCYH